MITPELLNYVNQIKQTGKPMAEIKQELEQAGWPSEDITAVLTPPSTVPLVAPSPIANYSGLGLRICAQIFDFVIWFFVFGYIIAAITGQTTQKGFSLTGMPALVLFILAFIYFIALESLFGATPGKMILKLKVTCLDGSKANLQSIIIRNILRLIDFLPFFYILGMIMISGSSTKQRLGDKLAGTIIVKK